MKRKAYALLCLPLGFLIGCGGSSSSGSPVTGPVQVVGITATSGSSQSAASGKAFPSSLTATVTTSGVPTGGEKVTFTAPASGASGTFANGTATETDVTNNLGVATSSPFTANAVGGAYTVTASVKGAPAPVSYSLTNIPVTSYSFYMSGQDTGGGYYALAGSVDIDPTGKVVIGEQDFNDSNNFFSPEPKGDAITGGMLTFRPGDPPGQATLTLQTNNTSLGLSGDGKEVFGVQFVNASHALIMQFDGFATSSGSMDLQTLPSTASGAYAFALSGFDSSGLPVAFGGVFSINGTTISNGMVDINDSFNTGVKTGKPFNGTISAPDGFGRGTIKGLSVAGFPVTLNYYMVGPEAIRLIEVHASATQVGSAVGSAFGQGAGTFSNASLGPSVLAIAGNQLNQFAGLAQFTTSNTSSSPADFAGVGDESEPLNAILTSPASQITGTYSIAANGYGSLAFNTTSPNYPGLGNITTLGIYMTDPALNLNDPNNKTGGGGALVVDLDAGLVAGVPLPGGSGVIVPQTDTAATNFAGNYAVGWQNFNTNSCGCEFDMVTQGTMVANGALSLTGLVSDPLSSLGTPDTFSYGNTFVGTPLPDTQNPGRYEMLGQSALTTVIDTAPGPNFEMVIYQASGGQLFWLDFDSSVTTVSLGPLEQQGSLTGTPAASKPAVTGRSKRKH